MSVEIDPAELGFHRPFTVEVAQVLKIKNPNGAPVAFKVKTTAPKQYCVRPNSGRIEPGHEVEVSVLLQAMKQEPPADARCRDKFLVQSVTITSDKEFTNVQQIWDTVDKASVKEKKIRVNWLSASEAAGHAEAVATPAKQAIVSNGVEATPDAPPPAYSSPSDNIVAATPGTTRAETVVQPETSEDSETTFSNAASTYVQPVKAAVEVPAEEVKQVPAKVEPAIDSLKSVPTSELRQRKAISAGTDEKVAPVPELAQAVRQGTEGVPIHIVAALCMVSFLLAYFFF